MKAGCLISIWMWAMALSIFVLLSGCATFDAAQTVVSDRSARAADDTRQTAEWTLCNAISVGAWRRAYAADPEKAQGWRKLCAQHTGPPQ